MTEVEAPPLKRPILALVAIHTFDALLLAGWVWSLAVLVSGGWEWRWPFGVLRARTASSVIYGSAALTFVRFALSENLSAARERVGRTACWSASLKPCRNTGTEAGVAGKNLLWTAISGHNRREGHCWNAVSGAC